MSTIKEDTSNIVDHLVMEGDTDDKIRKILEREIRCRISEAQLIDERLRRKYGITLDEFEKNEMIKKLGYSFEVESDYHDWDNAIDQIKTLKEDLKKLLG